MATNQLPRMIGEPERAVQLRQATVVGTPGTDGTVSIRFGTGAATIAGVRRTAGFSLAADEAVWVFQQGYDLLVLGKVTPAGGGSVDLSGGKFVVNSASATNFRSSGAGAGMQFDERDDAATSWVWYANADLARLWRSGAGDLVTVDGAGRMHSNRAWWGTHAVHTSYAHFGHINNTASSNYNFLTNGSESIVNGPDNVYLSRNGAWVCRLDASGFWINDDIGIPSDRAIYLKSAWDGTHIIHHSSADDGLRYSTWNYHRFYATGAERFRIQSGDGAYLYSGWFRPHNSDGLYFENRGCGWNSGANGIINNYGEGKFRHHKNVWMSSGGWGSAPESESAGNQDVGWSWHMPGWRAAIMWLGTDNIFRLQNDNGAWPRFDVDVNDVSGAATKRDIEPITESVLEKMKQLQPIRFRRKPNPESRGRWEKEVRQGRWAPEQVDIVAKMDDELHAGFTAENMAEVFPEVATLNPATGEYDGIRYRELVSPLVRAVQELTDRIEKLERRGPKE